MTHTTEISKSKLLVSQFFEATYQFIEQELIPSLNWAEINQIFAYRHQLRNGTPKALVDVLPSIAYFGCVDPVKQDDYLPLTAAWTLSLLAGRIQDDIHNGEGSEYLWNKYGTQQALPIASFVLGLAQMALARIRPFSASIDIVEAFGKTLACTAQAQRERFKFSFNSLSIETYFANLVSRTAVPFATATWSGARLANATPNILDIFYQYGLSVGIAIQIEDDCRDLQSDLMAGIYTLPIIYTLSQPNFAHTVELQSLLSKAGTLSTLDMQTALEILTEKGAVQWSLRMAHVYRAKAINSLANLPDEMDMTLLKDFAMGGCLDE